MDIRAKTSKRFQLPTAIKFYLNGGGLYEFMSLYSDNEPYPYRTRLPKSMSEGKTVRFYLMEILDEVDP